MNTNTVVKVAVAAGILTALAGVYSLTPVGEYLSVDKVIEITRDVPESWLTAAFFLLVFFLGGALLVPIPLMAFAVSLVFDLWVSVAIAIPGFLLASLSGYAIGWVIDTETFGQKVESQVSKIKRKVSDKGAWAVLALRVAPTPPFTVTSIISGATKITPWKYMVGSTLGIMPLGLSAIFFGRSAMELMRDPSGIAISTLIAAVLLLIVYMVVKHKHSPEQEA